MSADRKAPRRIHRQFFRFSFSFLHCRRERLPTGSAAAINTDRAHIGRWKEQFDEPTRQRINEHYARLVERLRRQDVPIPREA